MQLGSDQAGSEVCALAAYRYPYISHDVVKAISAFSAVLRIRIRIRIRIHVFLGLQDPDPLVRGMDPDPALDPDPDPSIIMQK